MRLGRPLAPGVAVARAYCLDQGPMSGPARPLDPSETPNEIRRFEGACAAAAQELDARITRATARSDQQDADLLHAHRLLLADPVLAEKVRSAIGDRRMDAESALRHVLEGYDGQFARIRNDYLKQRVADLRCVISLVLRHLQGHQRWAPPSGRTSR